MKRVLYKNRDGFTIVELLVTILVGAILLTSAGMLINSQAYLSQRNRDLVLVNAFAEGKIESLRSTGFLGLSDGTTDITAELPEELNDSRSGSLVISPHSSAIKKIELNISYNEQGANRSYSYTTHIGELGVGQ
jgi:prepilin-type N-terminal cleavage/methylation domain-containing protein